MRHYLYEILTDFLHRYNTNFIIIVLVYCILCFTNNNKPVIKFIAKACEREHKIGICCEGWWSFHRHERIFGSLHQYLRNKERHTFVCVMSWCVAHGIGVHLKKIFQRFWASWRMDNVFPESFLFYFYYWKIPTSKSVVC